MKDKDRFFGMFHGVFDIVSITDTDYNILMVNKAYEKLLNKTEEECIDHKCYKIIRNRETPCEDCPIVTFQEERKPSESLLISIGDEKVSLTRHPIYNDRGEIKGIFEIGRIVTRELKMQQALQHQGRLKILGELASSIVHEIKNPLAGIGLMTISLMERLHQEHAIYSDLEGILSEIQRLEKLLVNLSNFAKPSPFVLKKTNIHSLIDNTLKLLSKKCEEKKIRIRKSYYTKVAKVRIDSSKMKQVFFNIFLNAITAVPNSGEITITTDLVPTEASENMTKEHIRIAIHDNGIGIKEEDQPHIFDPFFSKSFKGTGLGLSIVFRIIELHHGLITVQSKEGIGTTVTICIPINNHKS
ncbi:MAG: two-component system sensor histidine kinase NtrB [bacterium]